MPGRARNQQPPVIPRATRSPPRTEIELTTEATENTERMRAGVHSVPSAISVSSVVQYRIQGHHETLNPNNSAEMPELVRFALNVVVLLTLRSLVPLVETPFTSRASER